MNPLFGDRFVLGANYWSRAGGPRMWERFDEQVVRRELAALRAIGLDVLRIFAFIPSFVKEPPRVEREPLGKFERFLALAGESGLGTLPTALVGHMSGENYDFAGQAGRSLYSDPELLAWQKALIEALCEAGRDAPSVLGWVLSNEMPLWAGPGDQAAPAAIVTWCETLTRAIRARDGRPIGTGDGVMAGFPTRALAGLVDYVAPHVYYGDADPLRQAYQVDFAIQSLRPLGLPILLEEFGCSSTQAGEPEQAAYYREAIHVAWSLGASGAVGWCANDFDPETLGRETPYSHHGFELGFGLFRKDGSEKPVCDEFRAMRRLLEKLGGVRPRPSAPAVALVRPRYLDEDFPFSWQDREALRLTLLQGFVLACQAGLDPVVVTEGDDLSPYALLLCPATQKLTTPTWLALRDAVQAGATLYWSYFSGDHRFHQGMWCPIFPELTGLVHRLRYGCFDLPPERFILRGAVSLSIPTGIGHAQAPYPLSRLPVAICGGAKVEVLARDEEGHPALFSHALGSGRCLFLTYPLERYLAGLSDGSSRDAHRLYRLVGDRAGLAPRYPTHHPAVQSRVLTQGEDELVLVQHRGWHEAVDDATSLPREAELIADSSGRTDGALGPKGVRLYRIPHAR